MEISYERMAANLVGWLHVQNSTKRAGVYKS